MTTTADRLYIIDDLAPAGSARTAQPESRADRDQPPRLVDTHRRALNNPIYRMES